jgi:hypothetical protein
MVSSDFMGEPNRPLALLRVGLGLAQVMGATITLYLLLMSGVSALTMAGTAVTLVLSLLSRLIFAKLDHQD